MFTSISSLGCARKYPRRKFCSWALVEAARVGVIVGDVLEHVAGVARFGGGFDGVDQRAHLFLVARLRSARGEKNCREK